MSQSVSGVWVYIFLFISADIFLQNNEVLRNILTRFTKEAIIAIKQLKKLLILRKDNYTRRGIFLRSIFIQLKLSEKFNTSVRNVHKI